MLRSLIHYWRIHLAVLLAAAVAAAVLTGALLVGDSMRGSLRALVLDRLGTIDHALLSTRFFRASLADELPVHRAAPLIALRGSATVADSGARASGVALYGVDDRFPAMYEDGFSLDRAEGQVLQSAVLNTSLAQELGVGPGDDLILRFEEYSAVPREALMGDTDPADVLSTLRLTVRSVISDRGAGRFGLTPHQQTPLNAFVPLPALQRALDQRERVNAIVSSGETPYAGPVSWTGPIERFTARIGLDDLGLSLRPGDGFVSVDSERFVLREPTVEAVEEAAEMAGAAAIRIQTYIANAIRAAGREVPYSLVAAIDAPDSPESLALRVPGGGPIAPGEDGILLNRWTVDELRPSPGDPVELEYYVVGPREEILTRTATLRFSGIVAMSGLGADNALTPEYPGIQDADDMSEWDPPFPIDLGKIRDQDEAYWDRYGATPKAFVSEATGARLWDSRWGTVNAVRVVPPAGEDVDAFSERFRDLLRGRLHPANFGMAFHAVREEGLAASVGATDFAGLFVAFSFFLIVAAALLIGLLFKLGVEQRAREVGLLLAVGYPVRSVRRRLLGEGTLLAAGGSMVGVAAGVGFAWLMLAGLRTLWLGAVGSSEIELYIRPVSLLGGAAIAMLVVLASIAGTIRRMSRLPGPMLLAGVVRGAAERRRARLAPWLTALAGATGVGLFAIAWISGETGSAGLAFGTGAALLVAGLSGFAWWCRARSGTVGAGLGSMAARNTRWSAGRSLLSVALVASACFVIVAVGLFRVEFGDELEARDSGTGGFALFAESDVPLYRQPGRAEDRRELGFSDEDSAALDDATFYPLRLLPGDDASCLNLYQPDKPRVLGVPEEMVARGGFRFVKHAPLDDGADPWTLLETPLDDGAIPAFADANSAQWILHKGLGDEIELQDDLGRPVRLRLVGLIGKGILQSEVLISEAAFVEHFPERSGYNVFLVDAPFERAEALATLLESNLERFGLDVTTTRAKLERFQAVEHTYLSTFQLLGGFGLLLGTVGLGIVMARNVLERRGELATLAAFGFRSRRLVALVLAENAFLLGLGVLLGGGSATVAVLPRLAVTHLPWGSLGITLVAVLAVGMLSGSFAARAVARLPLLPALRSE